MIIVKIEGGLGNQLFQISLYFRLCRLYGDENVLVDISDYNQNSPHNGYELEDIFHLSEKQLIRVADEKDLYRYLGKVGTKTNFRLTNRLKKVINERNLKRKKAKGLVVFSERDFCGIKDLSDRYQRVSSYIEELNYQKDYYFVGWWCGQSVFAKDKQEFEDTINKLRFPEYDNEKDIDLCTKVQGENSVAIHVRCGDYVGSDLDLDLHCYYLEAVEYVNAKISSPVFYIFSDDKKMTMERYSWMKDMHFVEGHNGNDSFRDMQLMSCCRVNIIANSTFSMWAGYLNMRNDNLIIYPGKFKKDEKMTEIYKQNVKMIDYEVKHIVLGGKQCDT